MIHGHMNVKFVHYIILLIANTGAPAFKVLNWANKRTQFLLRGQ
jgi:hypothetical protein